MAQKYRCTIKKPGKVGEPSSKYGYPGGGELFEQDIARHVAESEALYEEFVEWMKSRQVDPSTVRAMFVRFYYEFCEVRSENHG